MPERDGRDPGRRLLSSMIAQDHLCDLDGGVAIHAEWRAAADLKPDGLTMVATDGHRLAYVESRLWRRARRAGAFRALVPQKAMSEILKLAAEGGPDAKTVFAGDDNHLFFQFGDRLLISRKLTGNFPGLRARAPKDHHAHRRRCSGTRFESAIERVAQFADERSRAIRVQFTPGEVKVFTSSCRDRRERRDVFRRRTTDRKSRSVSTRSTCSIFCAPFRRSRSPFSSKDQKSAGEMRPAARHATDQYRYVVMPMRI